MTSMKQYALKITKAWQKSIDAIFECGDLLIEAKAKLKHGEFEKMVEQWLPFTPRTSQMFMKIAADKRLIKAKHASLLPPSWYTCYQLTTLSDEDFQAALDDGTINPEMTRVDIPLRVEIVNVVQESDGQPEIVTITTVPALAGVPARVPVGGYITEEGEQVPRWSDTTNVDVRVERLIEALEQLAELADPAAVNRLIENLDELGPVRLSCVHEAVHAISRIEAALKSRFRLRHIKKPRRVNAGA
jgi:hypothetical protein